MGLRGPKARPVEERFWGFVDKTDTCWLWTGYLDPKGYPRFNVRTGLNVRPYRFAYELLVGPIPEGLELDHLCRTPPCVNPSHLEPVTHAENVRRAAAAITACPQGHSYGPGNDHRRANGKRVCRPCNAEGARRWRERQKVAV